MLPVYLFTPPAARTKLFGLVLLMHIVLCCCRGRPRVLALLLVWTIIRSHVPATPYCSRSILYVLIFALKAYHGDGGMIYDCISISNANSLLHIIFSLPCRQQEIPARPPYQISCQRQQCRFFFCFASGLLLVWFETLPINSSWNIHCICGPPPPLTLILSWVVDTLTRQRMFTSQRAGERRSYPEGSRAACILPHYPLQKELPKISWAFTVFQPLVAHTKHFFHVGRRGRKTCGMVLVRLGFL